MKIRHSGEFKLPDLQKIVDKMKNMTTTALDAYNETGLSKEWEFIHIFATNADLAPTSMQYLITSEGICVWDKKFLGEHVWPVALGKRFRAGCV